MDEGLLGLLNGLIGWIIGNNGVGDTDGEGLASYSVSMGFDC